MITSWGFLDLTTHAWLCCFRAALPLPDGMSRFSGFLRPVTEWLLQIGPWLSQSPCDLESWDCLSRYYVRRLLAPGRGCWACQWLSDEIPDETHEGKQKGSVCSMVSTDDGLPSLCVARMVSTEPPKFG